MKKNVQVIDSAVNSIFKIFEVSSEQFNILFPNHSEIAFLEDYPELIDDISFWSEFYKNRLDKIDVVGIHGTLHLTGSDIDKSEFPNRRELDVCN
ncbi:hypothetical protein [Gottfriedia solisilvae]|uniref:Uncharacterized protein n=1 Tax=Gottfriedia solisilvae TaxID=1516104 RepID=A0A8J3AJA1_9BACI|nr:hypothetical protein [Gottfriedia solisilvae]GGI11711.1 hypothetical protein GCM10007380_09210 [Gottfriedia solisilvae]